MGVIAKGILRGCQGLFTPVSLGYPLSVFNKNSTLKHSNLNESVEQNCSEKIRCPKNMDASPGSLKKKLS